MLFDFFCPARLSYPMHFTPFWFWWTETRQWKWTETSQFLWVNDCLCFSVSQFVSERVSVKRFSFSLFWCSVKSWRLWELCRSTSTRRSSPETSTAPSHTSTATAFTSDRCTEQKSPWGFHLIFQSFNNILGLSNPLIAINHIKNKSLFNIIYVCTVYIYMYI